MTFSICKLRHSYRKGFSLVEVSIAAAISLFATLAIMSIFIAASKMTVESFVRNKALMDARLVIDKLTSDVRMATSTEASYKTYKADKNTLILKLPSINAAGFAVDPDTKFDYIIYRQAGQDPGRFIRTVSADASSARTNGDTDMGNSIVPGVYAVQPDAVGNFVVYYEFNSVQKQGDKSVKIPAAGAIQLRNHG